ncbi:MAG TPA: aldehyde dehydrogenase family protein, partial [Clostridia bacterium]|nr:aldehyde dehydrogenase family protein [Clostridia bacterium]
MDASSNTKPLRSTNPATGALLREFAPHDEVELDRRLSLARQSFHTYRRLSFAERSRYLLSSADILDAGKHEFGRLVSLEMGKPLKAAVQEVEKCAAGCRFYAENAAQLLADEVVRTGAGRSFVTYQPIGPVLAIMPWNFPFWQVFRFAAPALMAGNVALLKHASNVPQCALAIEKVFHQAGFPEGVFQTLLIGSGATARVIEDPRIVAVTLTGSVAAGASVAAIAAKKIKKTVLELGGSDPFIVLPSADLPRAVKTAVQARTINNGQSCIAAKRFIIHRQIADAFQEQFVAAMSQLKIGDPLAHDTDIGPLATSGVLEGLQAQVDQT